MPAIPRSPRIRHSLAGKVLEVNAVGQPVLGRFADPEPGPARAERALRRSPPRPPSSNPSPDLARCLSASTPGTARRGQPDRHRPGLRLAEPDPDQRRPRSATLPAGPDGLPPVASGCAVADGVLYVASLDATSLYGADITATSASSVKLDTFSPSLVGNYGRLITVVADPRRLALAGHRQRRRHARPKGASHRDERILHIHPAGAGGAGSVTRSGAAT